MLKFESNFVESTDSHIDTILEGERDCLLGFVEECKNVLCAIRDNDGLPIGGEQIGNYINVYDLSTRLELLIKNTNWTIKG